MNQKEEMNFLKNYMNGMVTKKLNYYIEEQEMVHLLVYFIINVIIKDQHYVYAKMKRIIFLEDILLFLGQIMVIINLQMEVSYSH